jgi:hypothetical protein
MDVQAVDIETRLEDAMMKRMNQMEQRLEEVARQRRKEQTDMVVFILHTQNHQEEANWETEDEEGVAWSGLQRHDWRGWRGTL